MKYKAVFFGTGVLGSKSSFTTSLDHIPQVGANVVIHPELQESREETKDPKVNGFIDDVIIKHVLSRDETEAVVREILISIRR